MEERLGARDRRTGVSALGPDQPERHRWREEAHREASEVGDTPASRKANHIKYEVRSRRAEIVNCYREAVVTSSLECREAWSAGPALVCVWEAAGLRRRVEAIMRLLPASDVSTLGILLILGSELASGLLFGFVCALLLRRRGRTARTPDPKGGMHVLKLPARHAPDARKAA